jgi:bifunctional aspartokinase / homoserine dehydrogenase 1
VSHAVWKFGGSSLGTAGRLRQVLSLIRGHRGSSLVVVVSALGDTTDWLIEAARQAESGDGLAAQETVGRIERLVRERASEAEVSIESSLGEVLSPLRRLLEGVALVRECTPRTLDEVLAVGERLSCALVSRALGVPGIDSRELVLTDDTPQQAVVEVAETGRRVRDRLTALPLSVVTGFIARSTTGRTTTLGRNGSDYTATLLAQALAATEVTVWTDVPGVFTADPNLVRDAWPVTRLTYSEALELAHFGTRMFHARTVVPLEAAGAALHIRSTTEPERPGTRIDAVGEADDQQATCVTSLEQLALVSLQSRQSSLPPAFFGGVLEALGRAGIRTWMTNQSGLGVSASLVVSAADRAKAEQVLQPLAEAEDVAVQPTLAPVSLVSLVAERMGRRANVAGRFFHALGNVGIQVLAIAQGASQRSISCVVSAADTAVAVRTVHAAFNLAAVPLDVALVGHGTVGGRLLAQLKENAEQLKTDHGVQVRLVGLYDRTGGTFDPDGVRNTARESLSPRRQVKEDLAALGRLPNPVLVDCTAADDMNALYESAFANGIHVVAANKKPLTSTWAQTQALHVASRRASRSYLYETTCGASLPVIETLKNLVRTGDVVHRIDGSLSGTLGYLCDAVMKGTAVSSAVASAKERGLTEPHPRDDLSGTDVARKALILARELGAQLELADVSIEPFIAPEFLAEPDPDRFLAQLSRVDDAFAAKVRQYQNSGLVLRYLAQLERTANGIRLKVGPVAVDALHPAASLRGEESMVAFSTNRYRDYPLIVRGAGAGGDVTAAGVLADILRLAHNVRGR